MRSQRSCQTHTAEFLNSEIERLKVGSRRKGPDTSQDSLSTNPLRPTALLLRGACRQLRGQLCWREERGNRYSQHIHTLSLSLHKHRPLDAQPATRRPRRRRGMISRAHTHARQTPSRAAPDTRQQTPPTRPAAPSQPCSDTAAATQNSTFLPQVPRCTPRRPRQSTPGHLRTAPHTLPGGLPTERTQAQGPASTGLTPPPACHQTQHRRPLTTLPPTNSRPPAGRLRRIPTPSGLPTRLAHTGSHPTVADERECTPSPVLGPLLARTHTNGERCPRSPPTPRSHSLGPALHDRTSPPRSAGRPAPALTRCQAPAPAGTASAPSCSAGTTWRPRRELAGPGARDPGRASGGRTRADTRPPAPCPPATRPPRVARPSARRSPPLPTPSPSPRPAESAPPPPAARLAQRKARLEECGPGGGGAGAVGAGAGGRREGRDRGRRGEGRGRGRGRAAGGRERGAGPRAGAGFSQGGIVPCPRHRPSPGRTAPSLQDGAPSSHMSLPSV